MMNNLHLSLTNIRNESRLFKEVQSLRNAAVFEHIFIAGLWEAGVEEHETLAEGIDIRRLALKTRKWPKNALVQVIKYLEFSVKLLRLYRKERIGVVTIHSLGLMPLGLWFKWLYRCKVVYDAHEYETETHGLVGLRKRLAKVLEKQCIRFFDAVIVVSESIADAYKELYPFMERPYVVLNTPRLIQVEKHNIFRETLGIAPTQTIFLYQGLLSYGRGIEKMLEVFQQLPTSKYVMVFMGYGPLAEMVQQIAASSEAIYYHEAVPPGQLLQYTASADVGISMIENTCLSYYYSLPNKLFEYVMAGLPVIASDLPEVKQILKTYPIGFIVEEVSMEVIENISKLDRQVMQEDMQRMVKAYHWEAQEVTLIKLYKKVMANE